MIPGLEDTYNEVKRGFQELGLTMSQLEEHRKFMDKLLRASASRSPIRMPGDLVETVPGQKELEAASLEVDRRIAQIKKLIDRDWQDYGATAKSYTIVKLKAPAFYEFGEMYDETLMCNQRVKSGIILTSFANGSLRVTLMPYSEECDKVVPDRQSFLNINLHFAMVSVGATADFMYRDTAKWRGEHISSRICGSAAGSLHHCVRIVLIEDRKRVYAFSATSRDSQSNADMALNELERAVELLD